MRKLMPVCPTAWLHISGGICVRFFEWRLKKNSRRETPQNCCLCRGRHRARNIRPCHLGRSPPALKAAGLGWVDFHVMRRTHATLMNDLHDNPKLVADQLGHTLDVNQNVYTRVSIMKRKHAVDALEAALPSFIEEAPFLR